MTPQQAAEKLKSIFADAIGAPVEFRGEVSVSVAREKILEVCRCAQAECGFDLLMDLSGVDNYGDDPRYGVVYHLYSIADRSALRLKVGVPEDDLIVD